MTDREKVIKGLEICATGTVSIPDGEERCKELIKAVSHAPTVDAVPVIHGTWIPLDTNVAYDIIGVKTWALRARCSRCGFVHKFIEAHTGQYVFCPNCGANMRGGTNER